MYFETELHGGGGEGMERSNFVRECDLLTTERAARMCPRCGEDSSVSKSYEQADGSILRRRKCKVCGTEFETIEKFYRYTPKRTDMSDGTQKQ